jgi:periplasmic divalent cation tolerance protein|tara:strand:- start:998 stop:1312 length:315 start_codon:yes stop_codon:yes gene_type:complete
MSRKLWVVKTTLPGSWREFEVGSFAQSLVESGAACVQHHKIASTYKWEGEIQSETEWSLQIKVSKSNMQVVVNLIGENHPYDLPQVIISEVKSSEEYSEWVDSQ